MSRQPDQESREAFVYWANNPAYAAYLDIDQPLSDQVLQKPHEEWMDLINWDAGNDSQIENGQVPRIETDSLRVNVDQKEDGDRKDVDLPQQDSPLSSGDNNAGGSISDANSMGPATNMHPDAEAAGTFIVSRDLSSPIGFRPAKIVKQSVLTLPSTNVGLCVQSAAANPPNVGAAGTNALPAHNAPAASNTAPTAQSTTAIICLPSPNNSPFRRIQSDAVPMNYPRTEPPFHPANTEELTSFVRRLHDEWIKNKGDSHQTIYLPDGYQHIVRHRKGNRRDLYVLGHPRQSVFYSTTDFFPHLHWLIQRTNGNAGQCTRRLCNTGGRIIG